MIDFEVSGRGSGLDRARGRTPLYVALALGVAAGCSSDAPLGLDPDVDAAVRSVTSGELAAHVRAIAHDSMAGRRSPGAGEDAAAAYIRARLQEAGLTPGVDGGWEQEFELFVPVAGIAQNVVGWIEGSDPAHRSEYVVVSAHFDHLGTGAAAFGDSIFNGADDNGSGTAALLELAEAVAGLGTAPRRSIVFAAFAAEEQGLLGSSFYVSNAPFAVAATVAVLNMDMLSRNSPDSVAVIRSGPAIGAVADAVAERSAALGLHVAPDPWPGENLLQRSDQWSFIREGVAGLLMTSGLHEDYHRRTDEPDRIDPYKLERVARLALLILLDLANPDDWRPAGS